MGKDVRISGGPDTIRQYLREGLIDELHIATRWCCWGGARRCLQGWTCGRWGMRAWNPWGGEGYACGVAEARSRRPLSVTMGSSQRDPSFTRTMQIRRYESSDWDAVCSIYDLSKPDEFRGEAKLPPIPLLSEDSTMKRSFQSSQIFVAVQGDAIVGFVGTQGNTVSWLFVHPSSRRALIAETLLKEAIVGLHGEIELNVVKSNDAAIRLYEKLGFRVLREVTSNFNGHECQVLRLQLPGDAVESEA